MVALGGGLFLMSQVPLYGARQIAGPSFGGRSDHYALEATQGQVDGFFSQLPYKYQVEYVGD